MSTVAVIQARTGSTRLPGKVLMRLCGKPVLLHIVERLRAVKSIAEVVVAIPKDAANQALWTFCRVHGISFRGGRESDVLGRFHGAARRYGADPVLCITADCPLIDPGSIEKLIAMYHTGQFDYVATASGAEAEGPTMGRFPDGIGGECFSFAVLETAWEQAKDAQDREHVTRFIWRQKQRFRCGRLFAEHSYPPLRLTVDHPLDFDLVQLIYTELDREGRIFPLEEVIDLLERKPELGKINRRLIDMQNCKAVLDD
jgi:spore coat polysaccharide biosynthesis protein SpsF